MRSAHSLVDAVGTRTACRPGEGIEELFFPLKNGDCGGTLLRVTVEDGTEKIMPTRGALRGRRYREDLLMQVRTITLSVIGVMALGFAIPLASGQQTREGEITNIAGDIYRFQLEGAYGIFLETPEGLILVDPVNTPTAQWLKGELDQRYAVPVRYVIYTHHHWDHIEGGGVFTDTAEIVAHENTSEAMRQGVSQTLPGASHDRNGDALLSREEAVNRTRLEFDRFDRNGDGFMSGPELFAEIPPPDVDYKDRMTLTLGGKSVELIYAGPNHAPDMSLIYFPEEEVLFNADLSGRPEIPGGWGAFDRVPIDDWIASMRTLESIDFEVLVHAHQAEFATREHVVAYRGFWADLRDRVAEAIASGMTIEEAKDRVTMEEYRDWPGSENHDFGGSAVDIFGQLISDEEAAKPYQGIRQAVQAAYINLIAYPIGSD